MVVRYGSVGKQDSLSKADEPVGADVWHQARMMLACNDMMDFRGVGNPICWHSIEGCWGGLAGDGSDVDMVRALLAVSLWGGIEPTLFCLMMTVQC